ncbi:MAG: sugar phosphate isomerase/epimerase family protein [Candidatus Thorarchaeota archaeon]
MKFGASFSLDKLQIADLVAAKRIGFDFVEFYIDQYWDDMEELELQLIAIRDILDSYDLFAIIHLPHLNAKFITDVDIWTNYVDRMSEQIELIGKLGITKKLVLHGVFGGTEDPVDIPKAKVSDAKHLAIKEWLEVAENHQMTLMLENLDESVEDLSTAFKKQKELSFTFDIGHANIVFPGSIYKTSDEKIYSILSSFKKQLKHIHIHDNLGGFSEEGDLHLPIGVGEIDFKKFFNKLIELKYDDTISLEIYNTDYQSIYLEASFKVIKEILSEL